MIDSIDYTTKLAELETQLTISHDKVKKKPEKQTLILKF